MNLVEILLISVGVAMDAFAVSICKGLSMKKMELKRAMVVGLWFGIFQALMPTIGFFLGMSFEKIIVNVDHWIAFVLLGFIGFKMITEAFVENNECCVDDTSFKTMLIMAIATSIDALAVGVAYVCAYGSNNAVLAFVAIGIVTFGLSTIGVKLGNKFGNKLGNKAEFAGGVILILLGLKILLEHLGILI